MKTFHYHITFSPYQNAIKAKNRKDAWKKLQKMWPVYNVKKIITLH